jgi:hypothetical protein
VVWADLGDMLEAQVGFVLHVVADFDDWTLIEDVSCFQLLLESPEILITTLSLQF